jgi:hypothetical protein
MRQMAPIITAIVGQAVPARGTEGILVGIDVGEAEALVSQIQSPSVGQAGFLHRPVVCPEEIEQMRLPGHWELAEQV